VARSRPREAEPHGRGARDQVARARRAGGAGGVARGACLAWSIYIYRERERERERYPNFYVYLGPPNSHDQPWAAEEPLRP
jgi:hypothetical protein